MSDKMTCNCKHEINIIECNECGDVIDVNATLSAARAEGYREALSELARKFEPDEIVRGIEVQIVADQLKSAYEKESDGNGK